MNLGMPEMIFIFIFALILLGPKKLPEIMRQVGKFMNEFKRASNEFKYQIESEINNLELEAERAKQQILPPSLASSFALSPQESPAGTIASGSMQEARPGTVDALEVGSLEAQAVAPGSSTDFPGDSAAHVPTKSPTKSVDA